MSHKKLGTFTDKYYQVETTFPDSSRPESAAEFGTYYSYAYTLADDPGGSHPKLAQNRRPDLFDKRLGRDGLKFAEYGDAKAVADLLREEGRITAGWSHNSQEKYAKLRRGPLKTRVVLVINTEHRELMP